MASSQLEQSQAQLKLYQKRTRAKQARFKRSQNKRISLLEAMGRLDESLAKLEMEKRKTTEIEKELKVTSGTFRNGASVWRRTLNPVETES